MFKITRADPGALEVGIGEIEDRLTKLTPRAAATVATRAAMRSFPILISHQDASDQPFGFWQATQRASYLLSILRCFQYATFANSLAKFDSDADAACEDAIPTIGDAFTAIPSENPASNVVYAASEIPAYASAFSAACATGAAYEAFVKVSHAIAAFAATATHLDINRIIKNENFSSLLLEPLWLTEMPEEFVTFWNALEIHLIPSLCESDSFWRFPTPRKS